MAFLANPRNFDTFADWNYPLNLLHVQNVLFQKRIKTCFYLKKELKIKDKKEFDAVLLFGIKIGRTPKWPIEDTPTTITVCLPKNCLVWGNHCFGRASICTKKLSHPSTKTRLELRAFHRDLSSLREWQKCKENSSESEKLLSFLRVTEKNGVQVQNFCSNRKNWIFQHLYQQKWSSGMSEFWVILSWLPVACKSTS